MQLVLSPKLTGTVEHATRTHTEECYDSDTGTLDLETLRVASYEWEYICHHTPRLLVVQFGTQHRVPLSLRAIPQDPLVIRVVLSSHL